MPEYHTLDDRAQIDNFLLLVAKRRAIGKPVTVCFQSPESHITQKQFNALHVWCSEVAEVLNDAGLDQRVVLKPGVAIDWDKDSVKEKLYKPLLEALTGKQSTTEQDTLEPNNVANHLARHLGEKFGVTLPEWPKR